MRSIFSTLLLGCALCGCQQEKPDAAVNYPLMEVQYPETKTVDQNDDYHGTAVADPYRWLEADTAADVGQWVKTQNAVSFGYLEKIPFRKQIQDALLGAFKEKKYDDGLKKALQLTLEARGLGEKK